MLEMRGKTRKAIHAIAAACKPGMVEEDAVQMAKDILAADDMVRGWHDVYVRFGSNTLKTFGAASEPSVVLKENDLFFIDIGPVWASSRAMVATPSSLARRRDGQIAEDAKKLFHIVRRKWENTGMSGRELYDFAIEEAKDGLGVEMDLSGHRLADFPHEAIYPAPWPRWISRPRPAVGAGDPYPSPD